MALLEFGLMHFKINMVSKLSGFLRKYWLDIILVFLILGTAPLFFYKLGQTSLVSWDEGWYAAIANNILKSGNFLRLTFNGKPFFDHPMAGFWWMAISFKLLGVSNFSARFPSAVFGILTLIFVYFLGKELFNKWVGFASAIALVSAPWFIYRSRSGDLDIFLTFFFVLSIWMAVKSVDQKKFFPFLGVSLGLLFLTKTLIPIAILPALIVIYIGRKIERSSVSKGLISFGIIVGIWFISLLTLGTGFISRYISVGLPGVSVKTSYLDNLNLVRDYIHAGIGKWFWPGVGSVFATLLIGKRSFYILSVFCLCFVAPFLLSNKTQIWHLIPLYPFMILSFFGFAYFISMRITNNKFLASGAIIAISLYFTFILVKGEWNQFINIPAYISDEQILSTEAGKYSEPLYVDGDFVPAAVFYSGKDDVKQTFVSKIAQVFKTQKSFLLITTKNRINEEGIKPNQYRVIKSDRDMMLIIKQD